MALDLLVPPSVAASLCQVQVPARSWPNEGAFEDLIVAFGCTNNCSQQNNMSASYWWETFFADCVLEHQLSTYLWPDERLRCSNGPHVHTSFEVPLKIRPSGLGNLLCRLTRRQYPILRGTPLSHTIWMFSEPITCGDLWWSRRRHLDTTFLPIDNMTVIYKITYLPICIFYHLAPSDSQVNLAFPKLEVGCTPTAVQLVSWMGPCCSKRDMDGEVTTRGTNRLWSDIDSTVCIVPLKIHVWCIYIIYSYVHFMVNVGKYTIHGSYGYNNMISWLTNYCKSWALVTFAKILYPHGDCFSGGDGEVSAVQISSCSRKMGMYYDYPPVN